MDESIEALKQTVELLASIHRGNERSFEEFKRRLDAVIESLARTDNEHEAAILFHREAQRFHGEVIKTHEESLRNHQDSLRKLDSVVEVLADNNRQLVAMVSGLNDGQKDLRSQNADWRDAIMRLSIIAEAHQDTLDDHDQRLGPS